MATTYPPEAIAQAVKTIKGTGLDVQYEGGWQIKQGDAYVPLSAENAAAFDEVLSEAAVAIAAKKVDALPKTTQTRTPRGQFAPRSNTSDPGTSTNIIPSIPALIAPTIAAAVPPTGPSSPAGRRAQTAGTGLATSLLDAVTRHTDKAKTAGSSLAAAFVAGLGTAHARAARGDSLGMGAHILSSTAGSLIANGLSHLVSIFTGSGSLANAQGISAISRESGYDNGRISQGLTLLQSLGANAENTTALSMPRLQQEQMAQAYGMGSASTEQGILKTLESFRARDDHGGVGTMTNKSIAEQTGTQGLLAASFMSPELVQRNLEFAHGLAMSTQEVTSWSQGWGSLLNRASILINYVLTKVGTAVMPLLSSVLESSANYVRDHVQEIVGYIQGAGEWIYATLPEIILRFGLMLIRGARWVVGALEGVINGTETLGARLSTMVSNWITDQLDALGLGIDAIGEQLTALAAAMAGTVAVMNPANWLHPVDAYTQARDAYTSAHAGDAADRAASRLAADLTDGVTMTAAPRATTGQAGETDTMLAGWEKTLTDLTGHEEERRAAYKSMTGNLETIATAAKDGFKLDATFRVNGTKDFTLELMSLIVAGEQNALSLAGG